MKSPAPIRPSGPRIERTITASSRALELGRGTAMVSEPMKGAGTDSSEPEKRLGVASSQTFAGDNLVPVDLEISAFDIDHHDLSLILGTYLREDVAVVDLVASPGEFLVTATGSPRSGSHVASIRHRRSAGKRLLPLRPDREQLGLAASPSPAAMLYGLLNVRIIEDLPVGRYQRTAVNPGRRDDDLVGGIPMKLSRKRSRFGCDIRR